MSLKQVVALVDSDGAYVTLANPLKVDVLLGAAALPVNVGASIDRRVSGMIAALNETVEINTAAVGSLGVQITSTWTGTIVFEATVDDVTWNSITADPGAITSTTANGSWTIACAGQSKVRVRASAWTSGSASVTLNGSTATSTVVLGEPLPSGDNTIGRVKVTDGTDVLQIDGTGAAAIQNPPNLDVAASTLATQATLATRASEATLATRASEATLSTRASETTLAAASAFLSSIDGKLTAPLSVTGPLTDAQLRASPVPVSGPLTDAQLRASAVQVGGAVDIGQTNAAQVLNTVPTSDYGLVVRGVYPTQGSTTSGQTGPLSQGAVTTAAPSYANGQTSPLSLTLAGALRTDSSAVTQPISNVNLDVALSTLALKNQFPTTLGQTTKAGSLSVAWASDTVGTAGTPSPTVLSVQGVSGGTDLSVAATKATAGAPAGFTVSTSAVKIWDSNTSAKARTITNNGSTNVFVGNSNAVTASGSAMGLRLAPGGSYNDSGFGLYNGELWAIGDAVSAAQNVSAAERT